MSSVLAKIGGQINGMKNKCSCSLPQKILLGSDNHPSKKLFAPSYQRSLSASGCDWSISYSMQIKGYTHTVNHIETYTETHSNIDYNIFSTTV